ncbi:MAG TPA: cytochrome c oxidase subunit 4 [Acidimicrobiales bacterium]|nr:cytochrome c oxidase subunit 4 [Acidimicrobiales bacterium]
MVTIGSKLFFGLSAFFVLAALVYGFSTGSQINGVLSAGLAGGIGEPLGYSLLLFLAGISLGLGVVTSVFRDADPEAQAEVVGVDVVPEVTAPTHASAWPVVGAFGAGVLIVGLVVEPILTWLGLAMLVATAVEWTMSNWADRATGDPAVNRTIRNRLMQPIEIPAIAAFGIAVFVLAISRVLLAVDKVGATVLFGVAATVILVVASLLAMKPQVSRSLLTAILLLGGVALIAGGVAGLAAGEREFEIHGEHGDDEDHGDEPADEQPTDEGTPDEEAAVTVSISTTED